MHLVEQVADLPVPLALDQPEVPVHEEKRARGTVDDGKLRSAWLPPALAERDLVNALERPTREEKVAVAAVADGNVELIEIGGRFERLGQARRLVVVPRAPNAPVDFLETDQVGLFVCDDPDNPLEAIAAVAPANAL